MSDRQKQALEILKNCGIQIRPSQEKYIIPYCYQDDVFPVAIGDDGGYDFFICEVPLCRSGDLIKVGCRYDTDYEDNMLVVEMKLKQSLNQFFWRITVLSSFQDKEEMPVYEFRRISF